MLIGTLEAISARYHNICSEKFICIVQCHIHKPLDMKKEMCYFIFNYARYKYAHTHLHPRDIRYIQLPQTFVNLSTQNSCIKLTTV